MMMREMNKIGLLLIPLLASALLHAQRVKIEPVDEDRVAEIMAMLSGTPRGFGEPIEQRFRWDSIYQTGKFNRLIAESDSISAMPFPKLTNAIYMSYFDGKDSETSKRFIMKRRMLLTRMVWAECLTNKGKYLAAIQAALEDILNTTSWTFPAEDQQKTNYEGKRFTIGLSSAAYGSDMAQSLYLLRSKLSKALKQKIEEELRKKIFEPTLAAIQNKNANKEFTSLTDIGNHNPVTIAYVTRAALTVLKDKRQRAIFATIAERYSNNFLESYLDDGYCSEGVGYYTYGFVHYLFLRETLLQATSGKLDLFSRPKVARMARFAPAMEIINRVFPAISDCEQYIEPGPQLMWYVNKDLKLGLQEYNDLPTYMEQPALIYVMFYFPNAASATASKNKNAAAKTLPVRDYFDKGGVLTVRPAPGSRLNMGATFKGGHNAEQHNHNDVGSYTIAVGNELITGDPGLATYTPKYFTKERYNLFKTAGSYGHNVPVVDGMQQQFGKEANAVIIKTDFNDKKDVFAMDITSAYPLAALKQLIRTFTYDRTSNGYIDIKDEYSFDSEKVFETALITRNTWKQTSHNTFEIIGKKEKLKVTVSTTVSSFTISDEVIDEGPKPYTRISIKLPAAKTGSLHLKFQKI
jgi:hypothetical protein